MCTAGLPKKLSSLKIGPCFVNSWLESLNTLVKPSVSRKYRIVDVKPVSSAGMSLNGRTSRSVFSADFVLRSSKLSRFSNGRASVFCHLQNDVTHLRCRAFGMTTFPRKELHEENISFTLFPRDCFNLSGDRLQSVQEPALLCCVNWGFKRQREWSSIRLVTLRHNGFKTAWF